MNTIKAKKTQTKMVAHRGVSGLEKENTNAAFVAAGNRSYYGIETDTHKTLDGVFIIMHDNMTGRVTNLKTDIDVEKTNYKDLKEIVLPDIDGSTTRQDLRIPLLKDYIKICKKYDKKAVLEIKNLLSLEDLAQLIKEIKAEDYLENVIFISFGRENCIYLRELLPNHPIQWLTRKELNEEMKEFLYQNHLDLDIFYERLTKEIIDELHSKNVLVNCWTCDDAREAENLMDMGVDFITSNIVEQE